MHYRFFPKASVNLLLDHRRECLCTLVSAAAKVKPGEARLDSSAFMRIDPRCVAGALVSDRQSKEGA